MQNEVAQLEGNRNISKSQKFARYCDKDGHWRGPKLSCDETEKEKTRNTLIITLISLVSILAIVVIALLIFSVFYVRMKRRNSSNERKEGKTLRDSNGHEYYDDVKYNKAESEVKYDEINVHYAHKIIDEENQYNYSQIEIERYENCNDKDYDGKHEETEDTTLNQEVKYLEIVESNNQIELNI